MSAASSSTSQTALQPYEALVGHADLELELAGRGELAALDDLGDRWAELVAGLPAPGEAESGQAIQLLERAHLIHERTRVELLRLRQALLADVATAQRGLRTAAGYGVELQSRSRVDRDA